MGLEKIKIMMKTLNITQDDLVNRSGIPKGTLSKITSGITKDPGIETVKAIVYSMGYTLDDLEETDNSIFNKQREQQHIKKYRTLSPKEQSAVDTMIDTLIAAGQKQEFSEPLLVEPNYKPPETPSVRPVEPDRLIAYDGDIEISEEEIQRLAKKAHKK